MTFFPNVKNAETDLKAAKKKQDEALRPNIDANNALKQMQTLLNDGFIVDRDFVVNYYPKLEHIAGSENKDELRELINSTYLEHLQQRIKTGALSIPKSFIAVLEHYHMGKVIKTYEGLVRQEMLQAVKDFPKNALKTKEPAKFLQEVQNTDQLHVYAIATF